MSKINVQYFRRTFVPHSDRWYARRDVTVKVNTIIQKIIFVTMDWRSNSLIATLSPFQRAIYEICSSIPVGRVTTYGGISQILERNIFQLQQQKKLLPSHCEFRTVKISSQAVGTALKRNPFAPSVPCHRVLKAGNPPTIGGFKGTTELNGLASLSTSIQTSVEKKSLEKSLHPDIQSKLNLLESEGVKFDSVSFALIDSNRVLMRIDDWNPEDMKKAALIYLNTMDSH